MSKEVKVKNPIVKMPYEDADSVTDASQYYKKFKSIKLSLVDNITFDCCYFEGVSFNDHLERVEFLDCIFVNCDLSNVNLRNVGFYRSEFNETKFIGSNIADSILRDVQFTSCIMDFISLTSSKVGPAIFNKSKLKESFFDLIEFKKTSFIESDLTKVNFSGSKLKEVNVSSSEIYGISATQYDLKGLTIDKFQAVEFCRYLEIKVEED